MCAAPAVSRSHRIGAQLSSLDNPIHNGHSVLPERVRVFAAQWSLSRPPGVHGNTPTTATGAELTI